MIKWVQDHLVLASSIVVIASALIGTAYGSFLFYTQAQASHALVANHVKEISILSKDKDLLQARLDSTDAQLRILSQLYTRERDTREYSMLEARKSTLNISERVRYCELYRKLGLGGECEFN